jgi:peptidoglycan-associated lipoprotein
MRQFLLFLVVAVILAAGSLPALSDPAINLPNHAGELTVSMSEADPHSYEAALAMLQWMIFRYENVHFDFDSHQLTAEARHVLTRKLDWIKASYPDTQMVVVGHCDERGTDDYNMQLGKLRAQAIKQFLVASGIAPVRIRIQSAGAKEPLVPGEGEFIWAVNRRAEFYEP